ncbi:hypothetical protein [Hyalangium gracile]|uniref:hypothetical protein n=1 Tax=Hyalangium gracile TaxID=394092 RepID=UPI001CCB7746|nr:hypothetical protein [Hyalangium gracile]
MTPCASAFALRQESKWVRRPAWLLGMDLEQQAGGEEHRRSRTCSGWCWVQWRGDESPSRPLPHPWLTPLLALRGLPLSDGPTFPEVDTILSESFWHDGAWELGGPEQSPSEHTG